MKIIKKTVSLNLKISTTYCVFTVFHGKPKPLLYEKNHKNPLVKTYGLGKWFSFFFR